MICQLQNLSQLLKKNLEAIFYFSSHNNELSVSGTGTHMGAHHVSTEHNNGYQVNTTYFVTIEVHPVINYQCVI